MEYRLLKLSWRLTECANEQQVTELPRISLSARNHQPRGLALHRFCLSFRDVEALLAERGITVSYEAIRLWCIKFGPEYARGLKRRQGRLGDTWHLDEVFVTIQGQRQYLWRGVHQWRRH